MKVSVIVPTLGTRETEIKRLLNSVLVQTYKSIEIVVVAQGNFEFISRLCESYRSRLDIKYVPTNTKGLSRARNLGVNHSSGDILLLSDDDCWYDPDALKKIVTYFEKNEYIDVLLTQIYDPIANEPYKAYSTKAKEIIRPIELLSRSSIEIAYRKRGSIIEFDELFGLGGMYVAGEENDFLIRSLKEKKRIQYEPIITVYHMKKHSNVSNKQLIAKGAFYSKNFGFIFSSFVLVRDLLIKHQNNYRWFWNGYFDYKRKNKGIY